MLNRRQRHGAGNRFLFRMSRIEDRNNYSQLSRRGMLEDLAGRYFQSSETSARRHLYAENRIAAKCKEVIVDANAIHLENFSPQIAQQTFAHGAWANVSVHIRKIRGRLWQSPPIDLAARQTW